MLRYRHALEAQRCLERLARTAGVPYRGYHALRHTCGTRQMRQTGDLEVEARVLGHSSIETTRIYAKWDDQRAAAAVATWWQRTAPSAPDQTTGWGGDGSLTYAL